MPRSGLRKWFELAAVVPLGLFVVVHVASYAGALFGARSFGAAPRDGFAYWVLALALVWLPLAFHVLYGLRLTFTGLESDRAARVRSLGLRVTGVASLIYLAAHLVWFCWPLQSGERGVEDVEQMLALELSTTHYGLPLIALAHVVGLSAVALHLGLGLSRFAENWGLTGARLARRLATAVSLILFLLGAASLVELATGSAIPRFLR